MGAFLDKPKTEKITQEGSGNGIRFGVSAMQGWRMEMEDAHVCQAEVSFQQNNSFFGVFDGHAGPKAAQHCSKNILPSIEKACKSTTNLSIALHDGFMKLDEEMKEILSTQQDRSGTTAIVTMLTPEKIIWANCGDSRGILCSNGAVKFATMDHKPYNTTERSRIEKAGGTVMMQRVNGSLAVSRALGDYDYKQAVQMSAAEQLVSPEPEITEQDRDPEQDQFLLLACDGIFDVMTNEEVVAYILHQLRLTHDLVKICSSLIDTCLNKVGFNWDLSFFA